jgi:hypothetical protein
MARKRAHDTDGTFTADNPTTPEVNEAYAQTAQVEEVKTDVEVEAEVKVETQPEPAKVETQPEPAKVELQTPSEEPVPAPPAVEKEQIETDVRKKLQSRTQEEDIFVPTSPAVLEAAAKKVAEQEGFALNRGTSIGARLLARSRKMV